MVIATHSAFSKCRKATIERLQGIYDLLNASATALDIEQIVTSIPSATVKDVKRLADEFPAIWTKASGIYPSANIVIGLIETALGGPITGATLNQANVTCKGIIDQISKPLHERFLRDALAPYRSGTSLTGPEADIIDLIYEEYGSYLSESGNGLVSYIGRYNEAILCRSLENEGLVEKSDFRRTGTDSKADLVIVSDVTSVQRQLYAEVKSYHARERLLRGLQDIRHPEKIGVGFFQNAKEFNYKRTETLANTGVDAIYMPDDTYNNLTADASAYISKHMNRMYRCLSNFPVDMKTFVQTGSLPKW